MAFDKTPSTWLGAGYSLAGNEISLETATAGLTVLTTCTAVASTDVITTGAAHGLKIGDRVQFTTTDTLPSGLSADVTYYVLTVPSTTTLTVSAVSGGDTLDITDTGSGTHSINRLATIPELTDTEANATSGDIRKILYALCERFAKEWNGIATADRPSNMTISKSISPDVSTGQDTLTYVMRFITEATSREVADE